MAGSAAEERIRARAEAMLRQHFPEHRIIHELVLQQGGCRIDLAAIGTEQIVLLEIKSERDVLTRLGDQMTSALRVGDLVGLCVTEKHAPQFGRWFERNKAPFPIDRRVMLFVEQDDGDFRRDGYLADGGFTTLKQPELCNPSDRLEMLWAAELQRISGTHSPRFRAKHLICETMTGRQIRRAVCAALRARPFPRADAPIHLPLGLAA